MTSSLGSSKTGARGFVGNLIRRSDAYQDLRTLRIRKERVVTSSAVDEHRDVAVAESSQEHPTKNTSELNLL